MTHGSLFSGIGGFDLAAEWMGWENKFHCEWNEFGQKVLKHYWPKAKLYGNIKEADFTEWRGKVDIVSGGFPCQPYSLAGKRKGKEDDRHLWPEMLRAIREIQPGWVVGENVFGLVNWSNGLVFHEVQTDLEAAGYEVFPYVLPACAVNAPHRRDRVWFVAYRNSNGQHGCNSEHEVNTSKGREYALNDADKVHEWNVTNTNSNGQSGQREFKQPCDSEKGRNRQEYRTINDNKLCDVADNAGEGLERGEWSNISSEHNRRKGEGWNENWHEALARIWSLPHGLSGRLDTNSISKSEWRKESLKAYGNSIVPQVAYQIFKAIEQYEIIRISTQSGGGSASNRHY